MKEEEQQPPVPKALNVTVLGEERGNVKQGWVQSDKSAHDNMWRVGLKNSIALPLLHYMVAHIRRGSGGVVVSAQTLARDLGVTPRTIQTAINVLKQGKFIQVLKSGNSNVYVLNSQVAWQGKRGERYAAFNATIKVHEQEQERDVDELIKESQEMEPIPDMSFLGDLEADVIEQVLTETQVAENANEVSGSTGNLVPEAGNPDQH